MSSGFFDVAKYVAEVTADNRRHVRHKMRPQAYKYERKRQEDIGTEDLLAREKACGFASRTAEKFDSLTTTA